MSQTSPPRRIPYRSSTIVRSDLKHISAEELMVIYQHNSPEEAFAAFNELYNRYEQKVFNFIQKRLHNQADAEDLLQKIFIKIHESKNLYKQQFKFEQWLFVIARTSILDHLRSKVRYQSRLDRLAEANSATTTDEVTLESLASLNEDQKEMLEMKFIDELSYQEMAKLLNKSETSLRKTVSRMMINLRKGDV